MVKTCFVTGVTGGGRWKSLKPLLLKEAHWRLCQLLTHPALPTHKLATQLLLRFWVCSSHRQEVTYWWNEVIQIRLQGGISLDYPVFQNSKLSRIGLSIRKLQKISNAVIPKGENPPRTRQRSPASWDTVQWLIYSVMYLTRFFKNEDSGTGSGQ